MQEQAIAAQQAAQPYGAAPRMYRVREIARLLDVHAATVYRAIERGQLAAVRIGTNTGALRVPHKALDAYLGQIRQAATSAEVV